MVRYSAPRLRNARPQCTELRGNGERCTLDVLVGSKKCVVHTKSGTQHSARCRCARCATRRRRARRRGR